MGLLTQTHRSYYEGSNYGDYQFITISDVINNFMISHVGRDKILNRVDRTDVAFHAQRALQELSYDTLKSVKTQEIEVCANLKMPLPQDYVNYVKLTSVDSAGIEHIIYPTSKTSNPFAIEQVQGDCTDCGDSSDTYQYGDTSGLVTNPHVLTPQEVGCGTADVTCTFNEGSMPELTNWGVHNVDQYLDTTSFTLVEKQAYWDTWFENINAFCMCLQNANSENNCGYFIGWQDFNALQPAYNNLVVEMNSRAGWSNLRISGANGDPGDWGLNAGTAFVNRDTAIGGTWGAIDVGTVTITTPSSNAWDNYTGATPSENQDDYQDNTYWPAGGERYGLDPQHAQANGSYFIDCLKGMIHFSSNLSGKTIILKYISDSLGTDDEMVVHKFAEEAMYKYIAYAVLSSRSNIPEYIINRFRRERFATKRVAKLRLSNIKLEEITQVLRGKSKQIKH